MLEKNYQIYKLEKIVSPKFVRRQKYLRKIENKFLEKTKPHDRKLRKLINKQGFSFR